MLSRTAFVSSWEGQRIWFLRALTRCLLLDLNSATVSIDNISQGVDVFDVGCSSLTELYV